MRVWADPKTSGKTSLGLVARALAADCALDCEIQGSFGIPVIGLRNPALQPLGFELEQLFFHGFEQHSATLGCGFCSDSWADCGRGGDRGCPRLLVDRNYGSDN